VCYGLNVLCVMGLLTSLAGRPVALTSASLRPNPSGAYKGSAINEISAYRRSRMEVAKGLESDNSTLRGSKNYARPACKGLSSGWTAYRRAVWITRTRGICVFQFSGTVSKVRRNSRSSPGFSGAALTGSVSM